jgi:hypothetical protein
VDEGGRSGGSGPSVGDTASTTGPNPSVGIPKARPRKAVGLLSFKTAGGLRIRADEDGFSVAEEAEGVEGGPGVKIFNPYQGRKKHTAAFTKWAKTNRRKLETMTMGRVLGALKRAGIRFVKVKQ